jgi:hypothetical protein
MFKGTRKLLRQSVSEEIGGKASLNRLVSFGAAAVLSYAFVKNSMSGNPLTWDLMLGYSVAMAMAASPTLAGKFLGLRYGGAQTAAEPGKATQ